MIVFIFPHNPEYLTLPNQSLATDKNCFGYLILAFKVLIGRCNLENKEAPRKTEDFGIHI